MRTNQYYVSLRKLPSRVPVLVSVYVDTLEEAKTLATNILKEEQYKRLVAVVKRASHDDNYKDGINFRDAVGFMVRVGENATWFPWKTCRTQYDQINVHYSKGE